MLWRVAQEIKDGEKGRMLRQGVIDRAQELLKESSSRYRKGGTLPQKRKATAEVEWASTIKGVDIWEGQIHAKQSSIEFAKYLSEHFPRKFDLKEHPSMRVDGKPLHLVELEHDMTPEQRRCFAKLQANYQKMVYHKVLPRMKRNKLIVNKYRTSDNPVLSGKSFGL